MPPAGPFLSGQKGAKEPAGKGGFRFPPFPAPIPLKTTKEGAFGPPSLESPPSCSTDSAPAAGAYSVTPPPHRPVWEETGRRCLDIGAGLSPARRWFPRVGADAYIGPYERTAAASPRRGRTLAGLSLPYLPFSTLVGAAFMAARGRPQGSPLRRDTLGRACSAEADAPGRPLLPLWGNSPSAHIGPPCARLVHLPCYPF